MWVAASLATAPTDAGAALGSEARPAAALRARLSFARRRCAAAPFDPQPQHSGDGGEAPVSIELETWPVGSSGDGARSVQTFHL